MVQNSSFSCMKLFRNHSEDTRTSGRLGKDLRVCFPHVGFLAVDAMKSGGSVVGEAVRSVTEDRPILLVASVEFEMPVTLTGMVGGMEVCDLGPEGPRIFGKRGGE
jgi:hypothetical protein